MIKSETTIRRDPGRPGAARAGSTTGGEVIWQTEQEFQF